MYIKKIEMAKLPSMQGNKLYLDYISGENGARDFFTFEPTDLEGAIVARRNQEYPRIVISKLLYRFNEQLGASGIALKNCKEFENTNTFCVITGQQVGFMGGPLYSLYKIITTIRLAEYLQQNFDGNFIPVFWGATEDHDFHEINHVHHIKGDGEIGRISFKWGGVGQSISSIDLTKEVEQAYGEYLDVITSNGIELLEHKHYKNYSEWKLGIWSKLFSDKGLVVVTPELIRGEASGFFQKAYMSHDLIRKALDNVGDELLEQGYTAMLEAPEYGSLYTFENGKRVRVTSDAITAADIERNPFNFSTDAALRPLLADSLLPVCASVLGPGEVAYQAMLKPLYDLFEIQQPVLFPRLSYTVVEQGDMEVMNRYKTNVVNILKGETVDDIFQRVVEDVGIEGSIDIVIEDLVIPEGASAKAIAHYKNEHRIRFEKEQKRQIKLYKKFVRKKMREKGYSKGEVRRLLNRLLPKGRMQERVLPMTHFFSNGSRSFIDVVFESGELFDFVHQIIYLHNKQEHKLN